MKITGLRKPKHNHLFSLLQPGSPSFPSEPSPALGQFKDRFAEDEQYQPSELAPIYAFTVRRVCLALGLRDQIAFRAHKLLLDYLRETASEAAAFDQATVLACISLASRLSRQYEWQSKPLAKVLAVFGLDVGDWQRVVVCQTLVVGKVVVQEACFNLFQLLGLILPGTEPAVCWTALTKGLRLNEQGALVVREAMQERDEASALIEDCLCLSAFQQSQIKAWL